MRRRSDRSKIVGESPELISAIERIERLAPGDLPILLLGESGTGKELAARHLHRSSGKRDNPFVAVNCAALSENLLLSDLFGHVRGAFTGADRDRAGVFETADGGTVFLDEIGDLPPPAQGMLLRVLQEGEVRRVGETLPRKVDARLVTATHRSLRDMVEDGGFRQDLYYRLSVGVVELPPLRDRGSDPVLLAEHLLEAVDGGRELTAAARARLLAYHWPGNVRELENVIRLAAALAGPGPIGPELLELPDDSAGAASGSGKGKELGDYHARVDAFRKRLVREAMEAAGGNKAEAARRLGLSRQALSYLTKEMKIV
jgi:transcriptional regulator with GAF, ATPase, and Fis domain